MKVLVVEDDPNLRSLWQAVFEQAGHETWLEDTEDAARAALASGSYDMVLLDLYLGSDRTIDVAALAKIMGSETKIVVVTGTTAFSKGELFKMSPAVAAVLRKPVDIEDLVSVCANIERGATHLAEGTSASAAVELPT